MQPYPEAGGQFLSSSSIWMGQSPGKDWSQAKRVSGGEGIRQKEEVLVLAEEKLHIYHFQNQQRPFHCIRELPSPWRSGALASTSCFHLEWVPGQEGCLSQEEQRSPLQLADPLK